MNAQFNAMQAGLTLLERAMATRRMACQKCLWGGSVAECDRWGDNLICPECGADVKEVRG